jgi:threonine/homoserine/homoserine lactone efflux protein
VEDLIAIALFSVTATLTPGPNNFMLMNAGLNHNFRRCIPHFLGNCIGFPVLLFISALGFGVIFEEIPITQHILKIFGATYLLYLAYKIFKAHYNIRSRSHMKPFSFMHAAIFQWKTPKTWLMANSALSIYASRTNYVHSVIVIGVVLFVVSIPCSAAWLVLGSQLKRYLRTETHEHIFNFFMAAALAVSVVLIFIE